MKYPLLRIAEDGSMPSKRHRVSESNLLSSLRMSYRGREGALKIHAPGSWGNYDDCGYLAPIALHIEQTKLGELLAELAKDYYAHV